MESGRTSFEVWNSDSELSEWVSNFETHFPKMVARSPPKHNKMLAVLNRSLIRETLNKVTNPHYSFSLMTLYKLDSHYTPLLSLFDWLIIFRFNYSIFMI